MPFNKRVERHLFLIISQKNDFILGGAIFLSKFTKIFFFYKFKVP